MARATEDVSRLPQWAQRRIGLLEQRLQEAGQREAVGPEDSDTFASPYLNYDEFRRSTPLGRGTKIRFQVGERRYFDVHLKEGELLVHGYVGLHVLPKSTNAVKLVMGDE